MSQTDAEPRTGAVVECPTCRARQAWSDECRRCRCDLSLLRRAWQTAETTRRQCLRHLADEQYARAAGAAGQLLRLRPDPSAWRLLAVCRLLERNWPAARAAAHAAENYY